MRTDDDSWDITTSVGSTALFAAASRALEAQKDEPLAVDPYAQVFCRAAGGTWADLVDGKAPDHRLHTPFGRYFQSYQGARTKYFDGFLLAAAEDGIRQVVILAAGLDSRGYRLPWPDGTITFELDQPKVLEFKRTVLAKHHESPTAQRREVAVDLREDWPNALREQGFEPTRPSAWIAEGLLVYLPADTQGQLFTSIDGFASPGSRTAIETTAPVDPDELERVRAEEKSTRYPHPFWTLVYNEQYADPAEWFATHGWSVVATPLLDYLRSLGRPVPAPGAKVGLLGELIGSVRLVTAIRSRP